ncbi:hypothetical protein Bca52824_063869 [Brassica carinata]|uniref:Mediator of RNA polymerase II transcription subunit 10 n=1 Tax=Brassica carinata TaxID=52824 RepID=A0A8X7QF66_BRACI|nr:hypothetical protein Bca52824_063869 [Brassica carinata]
MVFNLGSEVYMQAGVPDTRHIFMDVGLGFYVEFTRREALDYIPEREERIIKQLEEVNGVIAQIKQRAHQAVKFLVGSIYEAHHQIQQILNLPDENPSSYRQPAFHNSLVSELNSISKLSEKCNIQIPTEVLSLIDDGKNPDEFTRDVLNSCISRNQVTKGKTDAFKELRKHILEELEETVPDEVDKYREIRATAAAVSSC